MYISVNSKLHLIVTSYVQYVWISIKFRGYCLKSYIKNQDLKSKQLLRILCYLNYLPFQFIKSIKSTAIEAYNDLIVAGVVEMNH